MDEQDLLNALVGGVCMGVEENCTRKLLGNLSVRQCDVLSRIFGVGREREVMREIGSTYSISVERIRQIEAKALAQLRLLLFEEYEVALTGIVLVNKRDVRHEEVVLPSLSGEDAQWLVGFCEGDGTLGMVKSERSFISLAQKDPDVLEYVESIFPGGTWHFQRKTRIWSLSYSKGELKDLLFGILAEYVVSTHILGRLNDVLAGKDVAVTSTHEPSIDWLAGFFDAEGHVNWKTPSGGIQIGQKERGVLDAIQHVFGGSVNQLSPNYFEWYAGKRRSDLKGLVNRLRSRSHKFSVHEGLSSLLTRLYVEEHHIS